MALLDAYSENLLFRNTSNSNVYGGSYLTTRNIFFQSPGTLLADNDAAFQLKHTKTASGGFARGAYITSTLNAAANSDVLYALSISPTFNLNGFTSVSTYALHIDGNTLTSHVHPITTNTFNLGSTALGYNTVFTFNVGSSSSLQIYKSASENLTFSNGSSSSIYAGVHLTTGNAFFQSPGTLIADNKAGVQITHSITAATNIARAASIASTLTAAENNDVLVGLDIYPTFTNGAFTGITNAALRVTGNTYLQNTVPRTTLTNFIGSSDLLWDYVYTNKVSGGAGHLSLIGNGVVGMMIRSTNGRVMIQNGGTYTDANYQFQVKGTSLFDGTVRLLNVNTLASSSSIRLYQTADEATNTKYANIGWNGTEFTISTLNTGTVTTPSPIRINGYGNTFTIGSYGSALFQFDVTASTPNVGVAIKGTTTASTGNTKFYSVMPTINQSGTAGTTSLYVSPYFQSKGSGTHYIFDVGFNSGSDNTGTHYRSLSVNSSGETKIELGGYTILSVGTDQIKLGGFPQVGTTNSEFTFTTAGADLLSSGNYIPVDFRLYSVTRFTVPTITQQIGFSIVGQVLGSTGSTTITDAYTLHVGAPNVPGYLGATATNTYAIFSNGNLKVNGNVTITGSSILNNSEPATNLDGSLGTALKRYNNLFIQSINISANMLPETNATGGSGQSLGSSTKHFNDLYVTSINAVNTEPLVFRRNHFSNTIGGFHTTSSNFFLQSEGTIIADSGERLQVNGTSKLNGNTTINGTITHTGTILSTDLSNNLGAISNRYQSVFAASLNSGISSLYLGSNSSSGTFFRTGSGSSTTIALGIFATTSQVFIQPPGSVPANDGINVLQVSGSVKSSQYRLSALNTAPSSSTDTGALGEIRWVSGFVYLCTATNVWQRAALTTW